MAETDLPPTYGHETEESAAGGWTLDVLPLPGRRIVVRAVYGKKAHDYGVHLSPLVSIDAEVRSALVRFLVANRAWLDRFSLPPATMRTDAPRRAPPRSDAQRLLALASFAELAQYARYLYDYSAEDVLRITVRLAKQEPALEPSPVLTVREWREQYGIKQLAGDDSRSLALVELPSMGHATDRTDFVNSYPALRPARRALAWKTPEEADALSSLLGIDGLLRVETGQEPGVPALRNAVGDALATVLVLALCGIVVPQGDSEDAILLPNHGGRSWWTVLSEDAIESAWKTATEFVNERWPPEAQRRKLVE
jgi:hypothetical protein